MISPHPCDPSEAEPHWPTSNLALAFVRTLFCGLCLSACGAERLVGECSSNDECASKHVCNLLSRQCVRDAEAVEVDELQFQGSFHCEVVEDISTGLLGRSDVVGRLDGDLVQMTQNSACFVDPGGWIRIELGGRRVLERDDVRDPEIALSVWVKASVAAHGRRVEVNEDPAEVLHGDSDLASAYLASYDATLSNRNYVAFSIGGWLEFDDSVAVGERIDGELDLSLARMVPGEVGTPCTDFLECDSNLGLLCSSTGCSLACETQDDCDGMDAVCTSLGLDFSACMAPCQLDSDCVEPFVCTYYATGQGVCGPDFLVGVADEVTLGSSCQDNDDCGNPFLGCASYGGTSGMCTEVCYGECTGYIGMDVVCLPLDDAGMCVQLCTDTWDCPSGLLCDYTSGPPLCLPLELVQSTEPP